MIAILTAAATALVNTLGESAIYRVGGTSPVLMVRAVVRREVRAPLPSLDGVLERWTQITVRRADFALLTPARNDTITVGANTWRVLAIDQDDGYLIQLKVIAA